MNIKSDSEPACDDNDKYIKTKIKCMTILIVKAKRCQKKTNDISAYHH